MSVYCCSKIHVQKYVAMIPTEKVYPDLTLLPFVWMKSPKLPRKLCGTVMELMKIFILLGSCVSHAAIPLLIASRCNKLDFIAAVRARYFVAIIKNIHVGFVLHLLAKQAVQESSLPGQPPVLIDFPKVSRNTWNASLLYLYWRTTCVKQQLLVSPLSSHWRQF